jgi:NAD(P)-dependent dehydrogenase (short-subunit alcohol dehydrogenase family)
MKSVLITGVSSGIGYELSKRFLENGWSVTGISRRNPEIEGLNWVEADLSDLDSIGGLSATLSKKFHLAVLNAGTLGEIKRLSDSTISELNSVMDLNLWANKLLIDGLVNCDQVVATSSGASKNGSKGWGGYSISKASLNMLIKLYSAERPETHFTAVAPGVVETAMIGKLLSEFDEVEYPSINRIRNGNIYSAVESSRLLFELFPKLLKISSGEFIDVRNI